MAAPGFEQRDVPTADESREWFNFATETVRQADDLAEFLPRLYSMLKRAKDMMPATMQPHDKGSTVCSVASATAL